MATKKSISVQILATKNPITLQDPYNLLIPQNFSHLEQQKRIESLAKVYYFISQSIFDFGDYSSGNNYFLNLQDIAAILYSDYKVKNKNISQKELESIITNDFCKLFQDVTFVQKFISYNYFKFENLNDGGYYKLTTNNDWKLELSNAINNIPQNQFKELLKQVTYIHKKTFSQDDTYDDLILDYTFSLIGLRKDYIDIGLDLIKSKQLPIEYLLLGSHIFSDESLAKDTNSVLIREYSKLNPGLFKSLTTNKTNTNTHKMTVLDHLNYISYSDCDLWQLVASDKKSSIKKSLLEQDPTHGYWMIRKIIDDYAYNLSDRYFSATPISGKYQDDLFLDTLIKLGNNNLNNLGIFTDIRQILLNVDEDTKLDMFIDLAEHFKSPKKNVADIITACTIFNLDKLLLSNNVVKREKIKSLVTRATIDSLENSTPEMLRLFLEAGKTTKQKLNHNITINLLINLIKESNPNEEKLYNSIVKLLTKKLGAETKEYSAKDLVTPTQEIYYKYIELFNIQTRELTKSTMIPLNKDLNGTPRKQQNIAKFKTIIEKEMLANMPRTKLLGNKNIQKI